VLSGGARRIVSESTSLACLRAPRRLCHACRCSRDQPAGPHHAADESPQSTPSLAARKCHVLQLPSLELEVAALRCELAGAKALAGSPAASGGR
jgi:hypothetical protein